MPPLNAGAWHPHVPSLRFPSDRDGSITPPQPGKGAVWVAGSEEETRSPPRCWLRLCHAAGCELHLSQGNCRSVDPCSHRTWHHRGICPKHPQAGQFMDFAAHEFCLNLETRSWQSEPLQALIKIWGLVGSSAALASILKGSRQDLAEEIPEPGTEKTISFV